MEQVNRVDLTIKQEMLEILASMKGKTLKSIEGEYLYQWHRFSEIVRFNLGQFAVEIHADYAPVKWFWNSDEIVTKSDGLKLFCKLSAS